MQIQDLISEKEFKMVIKVMLERISEPIQNLAENLTIEELKKITRDYIQEGDWVKSMPVIAVLSIYQYKMETTAAQRN